jgi:MFS family permease
VVVFENIAFVGKNWLVPKIGPHFVLFLSGIFMGGGLVASSYCPNYYTFLLSYGVAYGLGVGLGMYVVPAIAWAYFPRARGVVTGLVFLGLGLAPLLFGSLFTFLVNPDNKSATEHHKIGEETIYYFHHDVYKHVPETLRFIGYLYVGVMMLSVILLRSKPLEQTLFGS